MQEARKMLREADANGDGRISREEFFQILTGPAMGMHDSLSMYDDRLAKSDGSPMTMEEQAMAVGSP